MPALKADFRQPEVQRGNGSAGGIEVRPAIRINDEVTIPPEVRDLESFCKWMRADGFPEVGRFSYLAGLLWVDMSMEELYGHNQIKIEFFSVLNTLSRAEKKGRFVPDGMWIKNDDADLSTVPDGMFVSYDAIRQGRVQRVKSPRGVLFQLAGSPEMVLEILSATSETKDAELLFQLYWKAGIAEYWLVDVRQGNLRFDLFKHGPKGYVAIRRQAGGWLKSAVFGKSFRLTQE